MNDFNNRTVSSAEVINWGFIGCGDVAEVKSGPAFRLVKNSKVAAVMSRNIKKAEDYARRHGIPRWTDQIDELVNDPEIDAVYVATPPSSHCEYTLMAARAGKHVYVEKPMALNYRECRQMIEAADESGICLFVAYYRRALPYFNKIRELLMNGEIGEILLVSVRLLRAPESGVQRLVPGEKWPWRFDPRISGGGLFMDLGSHQLDLLDYLFGPIRKVSGYAANRAGLYRVEDTVSASFVFSSGVIGCGTWCFTSSESERADETIITGSLGSIFFSTFAFTPIRLVTPGGIKTYEYEKPAHIQEPLIRSAVNHILQRGPCPSTGNSAARTSRIMDKIIKKYYSKGTN